MWRVAHWRHRRHGFRRALPRTRKFSVQMSFGGRQCFRAICLQLCSWFRLIYSTTVNASGAVFAATSHLFHSGNKEHWDGTMDLFWWRAILVPPRLRLHVLRINNVDHIKTSVEVCFSVFHTIIFCVKHPSCMTREWLTEQGKLVTRTENELKK